MNRAVARRPGRVASAARRPADGPAKRPSQGQTLSRAFTQHPTPIYSRFIVVIALIAFIVVMPLIALIVVIAPLVSIDFLIYI